MNIEFMREAIDLAKENIKNGNGPFGAVIVKDGKVIAKTNNSVTLTNDPTAHAEVNAIRVACQVVKDFSLKGCEIYTSCEPCPMCLAAIYWARIDKIYYAASRFDAADAGFDDQFLYDEILSEQANRKIPIKVILPEEGKEPFVIWKSSPYKIEY